jgi:hypothetical protein
MNDAMTASFILGWNLKVLPVASFLAGFKQEGILAYGSAVLLF